MTGSAIGGLPMASPMSLKLLLGAFVAIHMVVDRNKTKKMQTKYRHPFVKGTADSAKGIRNFMVLMWTAVAYPLTLRNTLLSNLTLRNTQHTTKNEYRFSVLYVQRSPY